MNDYGSKNRKLLGSLRREWSLFWETFIEDETVATVTDASSKEMLLRDKIESLSPEQVDALSKAISLDRKRLNQKLESLKKEMDLNSTKIEALKLVGGDWEGTIENLNRLNDLGQELSTQLEKVDERLKILRQSENESENRSKKLEIN